VLASFRGVVVANRPKHGEESAPNVFPVEVATHADLFNLEFAGPEGFSGAAHAMVLRLVEICHEVRIESNFAGEKLSVEHGVIARVAVQPAKVAERKGSLVIGCG